jgi:hypothetical protein
MVRATVQVTLVRSRRRIGALPLEPAMSKTTTTVAGNLTGEPVLRDRQTRRPVHGGVDQSGDGTW